MKDQELLAAQHSRDMLGVGAASLDSAAKYLQTAARQLRWAGPEYAAEAIRLNNLVESLRMEVVAERLG